MCDEGLSLLKIPGDVDDEGSPGAVVHSEVVDYKSLEAGPCEFIHNGFAYKFTLKEVFRMPEGEDVKYEAVFDFDYENVGNEFEKYHKEIVVKG